jgi:hypothetical protein
VFFLSSFSRATLLLFAAAALDNFQKSDWLKVTPPPFARKKPRKKLPTSLSLSALIFETRTKKKFLSFFLFARSVYLARG